jgi:sterol 3beta-glucosyltransferase
MCFLTRQRVEPLNCIVQENGVATAIEAIYRDLEYARTLLKRPGAHDDVNDAEHATIREKGRPSSLPSRSETRSGGSSTGGGPPSEDWSVVSDPDDLYSSVGSSLSGKGAKLSKRNSLTAAMLSVLPDALTSSGNRRPRSTSSASGSPP